MEDSVAKPVSGWIVLLRVLLFLFTPAIILTIFIFMGLGIEQISKTTHAIYQRTEPSLMVVIPLTICLWLSLMRRWFDRKRLARNIAIVSCMAAVAFLALTTTLETINTKPIVAAADSFKVPSNYQRVLEDNSDKFSPATSGLAPCIDIMGEGCPHIVRTWQFTSSTPPTENDLQNIVDSNGWTNVKIKHGDLFSASANKPHDAVAEGMVGEYKASVRLIEDTYSHDQFNVIMYLRPPNGPR